MYLFESPGVDEEGHNRSTEDYGRPLVGPSGYLSKIRYFPPEAVELGPGRDPKWPVVRKLKVFIANVIMCRPPRNDIDSADGKKAVKCCSPSARALVREFMEVNPEAGIQAVGAVATSLVRGQRVGINDYRGRVFEVPPIEDEPEIDIYRYVLRGVKPPEWWKPNEKVLRQILGWNRKSWRKVNAPPKPVKEKKVRVRSKRDGENAAVPGVVGSEIRPASNKPTVEGA